MVTEGCPGHGAIHLLASSAADVGFRWDPPVLRWARPGLPSLSNLEHFRSAVFGAWQGKVAADLCATLAMFRRDEALFVSVLVGGVWNRFF